MSEYIHSYALKASLCTARANDAGRLFLNCVLKAMITEEMRINSLLNKPNLIPLFNLEEESIKLFLLKTKFLNILLTGSFLIGIETVSFL